MIRLRPHHLLCVLTYAGRGYTPRFTSSMDDLIQRLGRGEEVAIVDGPDDICAPWLLEPLLAEETENAAEIRKPHCYEQRIADRDSHAAADIGKLLGYEITTDVTLRLTADLMPRLREAFKAGLVRGACIGCEWKSFCDGLSAADFADCRLVPDDLGLNRTGLRSKN